jgi:hypothetical protein
MGFRSWRKRRNNLVECATCSLEVPAKTGRCPNCGGRLRVPRPPPADEAGPSASSGEAPPADQAGAPTAEAPLDQAAAADAAEEFAPEAVSAAEELAPEAASAAETPSFEEAAEEAWEPPGGGLAYEEPVEEAEAEADDAQVAPDDGDTREP